jgi:hypothetical protein
MEKRRNHPEPVPPATQLAIMPFLAAIEGFLNGQGSIDGLRVTMHRIMVREGSGFFQQACGYLPIATTNWQDQVGRILQVNEGIIGKAREDQKIWRSKYFETEAEVLTALKQAMEKTGDDRPIEKVAKSYLAIPFLGATDEVVLILYADCNVPNFFGSDDRVQRTAEMCYGFARLFDKLQEKPFLTLRNFPLQKGTLVAGERTVYTDFQEEVNFSLPKFQKLTSFNFEASIA